MKFSLNMLQYGLERKNIPCIIVGDGKQFFRKVQLLDYQKQDRFDDVLYLDMHTDTQYCRGDVAQCTVLYCQKPDNILGVNYAYVVENIQFTGLFNKIIEVLEEFDELEQEVQELLIDKKTVQDFVNLISDRMGNPSYIVDASFKVLAINQDPTLPLISNVFKYLIEKRYVPIHTVVSLLNSPSWKADDEQNVLSMVDIPQFPRPFIKLNIRYKHKLQGYFFLIERFRKIHPGEQDLISQLEKYIVKLILGNIKTPASKENYYEHLLKDIISGVLLDKQVIRERLLPLKWEITSQYVVLVSPVESVESRFVQTLFNRLLHFEEGKPVIMEKQLYCVFPVKNSEHWVELREQLEQLLRQCKYHAGISEPYRGLQNTSQYVRQAESAYVLGKSFDQYTYLHYYQEYRIHHLIDVCKKHMNLEVFYPQGLINLEKHDSNNDTQYYHTLYLYLKNERNNTLTANMLDIHRNSLMYRIERIKEITEFDLDDAELRFQLMIAFEIRQKS